MTQPAERTVPVPDTDGELTMWLARLEELLIAVTPFGDDADEWGPPAAPLGDGSALAAARRVFSSVLAVERTEARRMLAPDGRFELIPIRFAELDTADLATVADALAALGQATLPGGEALVDDVVGNCAAAHRLAGGDLIAGCTRAHGLLDLATDEDIARLSELLRSGGEQVVLSEDDYAAYRRLTDRIIVILHDGDPLARFLYRG